jgi:hypothetical protein
VSAREAWSIAQNVDSIPASLSSSTHAANRLVEAAYAQARDEPDNDARSIAGCLVPTYSHELWEAWMQLGLYREPIPECATAGEPMSDLASSMMFDVLFDVAEYAQAEARRKQKRKRKRERKAKAEAGQ